MQKVDQSEHVDGRVNESAMNANSIKQDKALNVRISVVSNQEKEQHNQTERIVNDIDLDHANLKKRRKSQHQEIASPATSKGSGIYYVGDVFSTKKKQKLDDYLLNQAFQKYSL